MNKSNLKKRILVQDVGGFGFQTAGIRLYVEDLKPESNTQIGLKDFFKIAPKTMNITIPNTTSGKLEQIGSTIMMKGGVM